MHKSVFEKLEQFYSNPLDEYIKIKDFINNKSCYYSESIFETLSRFFVFCKPLRKHYLDLHECINENLGVLEHYSYGVGNNIFEGFEDDLKESITDSFLSYIEIITCMLCIFIKYGSSELGSSRIDFSTIEQLGEMIDESLKSINYKIDEKGEDNVRVIKIDPISEYVAKQSQPNMKTAILNYLSVRNKNIDDKERALHDIIDLLEIPLKKYQNVEIIGVTKEFAQIIRHPEVKKDIEQYKWFVNNKAVYLDKLFSLCVFTQQYVISKEISDYFVEQKKEKNNTK